MRSPPTCSPLPLLDVAVSALLLPRALHTSAHTRLASYPQSLLLTPAFSRIASHIHSARKGAVHLHQADPSILSFYSPSLQLLMLVMKLLRFRHPSQHDHPSSVAFTSVGITLAHFHLSTTTHTHTHQPLLCHPFFSESSCSCGSRPLRSWPQAWKNYPLPSPPP